MIRKNFRINIILRLLLLILLLSALFFFIIVEVNYLRSIYLLIFLIMAILELFYYIDRVNRDLSTFFTALLQNDFSTTFSEIKRGDSFVQLYSTINKITDRFKEIGTQKEQQLIFLEMLVEHVKTGIVSFDKDEKIHLMNQTTQKLFNRPKLHYLKAFKNIDEELVKVMRDIKSGEKRMIKIRINDQLLHLSIHASEFFLGKEYFKLLSIQDIKTELEANEVETWQKLIKVLTHEIMNSVSPITSLSDTMLMIIKKNGFSPTSTENIISGLEAIKTRSMGLQNFTHAYRKLTKIPKPEFQKVNICELLDRIIKLHQPVFQENNIKLINECNENLIVLIDPDLISQVIINILKNATEALENKPNAQISIMVKKRYALEIIIKDNGPGIPQDIADQIFVPFFTTKPSGSGIGLSLCRQIMHMHKGTLTMESNRGNGASFILKI